MRKSMAEDGEGEDEEEAAASVDILGTLGGGEEGEKGLNLMRVEVAVREEGRNRAAKVDLQSKWLIFFVLGLETRELILVWTWRLA